MCNVALIFAPNLIVYPAPPVERKRYRIEGRYFNDNSALPRPPSNECPSRLPLLVGCHHRSSNVMGALTCAMYEGRNLSEIFDGFRNGLPFRIGVLEVEYAGENLE